MGVWFLENRVDERWAWHEAFSKEECDTIVSTFSPKIDGATVVGNILDSNIRTSKTCWLESNEKENAWIYQRCAEIVNKINDQHFGYDLTFIENMQFTVYNSSDNGFYTRHIDNLYSSGIFRKLSFSILLNEPETFEGGNLDFHYEHYPISAPQQKGRMVAFPSATLHEVTPVTKGDRYSLVGWCCGPRFR